MFCVGPLPSHTNVRSDGSHEVELKRLVVVGVAGETYCRFSDTTNIFPCWPRASLATATCCAAKLFLAPVEWARLPALTINDDDAVVVLVVESATSCADRYCLCPMAFRGLAKCSGSNRLVSTVEVMTVTTRAESAVVGAIGRLEFRQRVLQTTEATTDRLSMLFRRLRPPPGRPTGQVATLN